MPPVNKPEPRKKKRRRKYRSPVKILMDECDELVREILKRRPARCVCCGSQNNLQVGHLIKRGRKRTRWSLLNCQRQCPSCNVKHNYYPEVYTAWFVRQYGVEAYQALVKLSAEPWKPTVAEMEAIKLGLMRYGE